MNELKEKAEKIDFFVKYKRWIFPCEVRISIHITTRGDKLHSVMFLSTSIAENGSNICTTTINSDENTACITDINIRKGFQRKGIGTKIIKKLEEILRNGGVKTIDGGDVEEGSDLNGRIKFWKRLDYSIREDKKTGRYKITKAL